MKRTLIIALALLSAPLYSQDYQSQYARADSVAASLPDTFGIPWPYISLYSDDPNPYNPIQALSICLTENLTSEELKARAIFSWILNHIKYDQILVKQKNAYEFQYEAEFVYKIREATCVGYSALFAEMCKHASITTYAIGGYVKDHESFEHIYPYSTHMWNVIYLNGRWHHIDLTWDDSNLEESSDSVKFLLQTIELITRRLPANPMWQFTSHPISLSDFSRGTLSENANIQILPYNFLDSIKYYNSLSPIDRDLFDARQAYLFNPICAIEYGQLLVEKGDSVRWQDYELDQERIGNEQKARMYYFEALKYLNPSNPSYQEDDKIIFVRDERALDNSKEVLKKIKQIDKRYKEYQYYHN